jgi:hypothetical protein
VGVILNISCTFLFAIFSFSWRYLIIFFSLSERDICPLESILWLSNENLKTSSLTLEIENRTPVEKYSSHLVKLWVYLQILKHLHKIFDLYYSITL